MTADEPTGEINLPETSVPGRLLATLLSQSTLVQPEVALTRATCFLLRLPNGSAALDQLVSRSGLSPELGGHWRTEVRGPEGGRTDLEYRWGTTTRPRVIVEAKIGHTLDPDQVDAYRSRLGDDGLLAVLVPVTRRREGQQVVEDLRSTYAQGEDPVQVDLWTWDEVANALEAALPGSPDVAQIRGLIEAAGALDILPFDEPQLSTADASRFEDLWKVVDRASWRLFDHRYSSQSGGTFLERYRYVAVDEYDAEFVVGIGRTHRTEPESWVWARIPDSTHLSRAAQESIRKHRADAIKDGSGITFPLLLEPGLSGVELEESLRRQLYEIALQIREGLRESLEAVDASRGGVDDRVLSPLIGMPAFTSEELMDSNPARRHDIEVVARQALRHTVPGRQPRPTRSEPFAQRFWFPVHPYTTHLSIGIERTDPSGISQPWGWLTIHDSTPRADVGIPALREAFPGEAVEIPIGWGVPLHVHDGDDGVEAFTAVVAQLEHAKATLRAALQNPEHIEV